MYPQEDIVQPRDRRAWTEEEDELLRAAIEKGTVFIVCITPCLLY